MLFRSLDGQGYAILDSYPGGGNVSDPRMQIGTLAYYYLLADPNQTMLMINGGFEPASDWSRHWIPAAAYDVGKPTGDWTMLATGQDPTNSKLTYYVYSREYDNALVLYKPLSYAGGTTGTTDNNTATVHQLNGTYRPLNADGTLGAPTTSVRLRNGEGAILIKV